jgi:hypothetical protein
MSRNIRLRFTGAQGSSESALGRNIKKGALAVKTTTTKSLMMAPALMFCAHTAWSYTVSGTTYTTNGTQADVQAACSAAPDNGTVTVVIPNGTYSWSGYLCHLHENPSNEII